MTENKVFIAEQETLLEVKEQTEKLIRNLIPTDAPIYGMVIHEASDLNPATRVEYLGANKDFKPMSMNMATHAMDYGSWADWSWLKANVPVMCGWDGEIKYYLNPDFEQLPDDVKNELKIMCVLFTEDVGGILTLVFDEDGKLLLETSADEGDLLYDEIGSELKIRQIRKEKAEFLQSLELFYKVFFLGEDVE